MAGGRTRVSSFFGIIAVLLNAVPSWLRRLIVYTQLSSISREHISSMRSTKGQEPLHTDWSTTEWVCQFQSWFQMHAYKCVDSAFVSPFCTHREDHVFRAVEKEKILKVIDKRNLPHTLHDAYLVLRLRLLTVAWTYGCEAGATRENLLRWFRWTWGGPPALKKTWLPS